MSVQPTVRTLRAIRHLRKAGSLVIFRGREEHVLIKDVAGALTGTNTLPVTDLAISHLVLLNPLLYKPYTDEPAPKRDEIFYGHNDGYIVRQVDYFDRWPDTVFIKVYAFHITRSDAASNTEGTSMALTANLNRQLSVGGETVGTQIPITNGDGGVVVKRKIAPGASDFLVTCPTLTVANLYAYGFDVDKGTLTIKLNNATTPHCGSCVLVASGGRFPARLGRRSGADTC
jgi:hypothetical protein